MASLLHLDSSANRFDESISRRLTALFADTWRELDGSAGYRYRDLAAVPVPPLNSAYCALGRRVEKHGLLSLAKVSELVESPAEQREWELTHALITEVTSVDTVLIGVPMYNYAIPASLKAWIDRVSFPGAFTAPGTGDSLLRDTRVVVITARGGAYGPGTPQESWDFQTPYLRAYFAKHGVSEENLFFVTAEMTMAALVPHLAGFRESAASSLATARTEVTALATRLTEPARARMTRTQ